MSQLNFGNVGQGGGAQTGGTQSVGFKWSPEAAKKAQDAGKFISIHKRAGAKTQGFKTFNPSKSWTRTSKATKSGRMQSSSATDIFIDNLPGRGGTMAPVRVAGSLQDLREWYETDFAPKARAAGVDVPNWGEAANIYGFNAQNTMGDAYFNHVMANQGGDPPLGWEQNPGPRLAEAIALYKDDKQKRQASKKGDASTIKKYGLGELSAIAQALNEAQKARGKAILVPGTKRARGPSSLAETVKRTIEATTTHFVDVTKVVSPATFNEAKKTKRVKKTKTGETNVLAANYVMINASVDGTNVTFASKAGDRNNADRFRAIFSQLASQKMNVQGAESQIANISAQESAQQFGAMAPAPAAPAAGGPVAAFSPRG